MVDLTEEYTLYLTADDTAQLTLNHSLLIDGTATCCIEYRATIVLLAGTFYDLQVTYTELTGAASISLYYSSPSLPKQPIPSSALYYSMPIVNSPFFATVVPGGADFPYTIAFGPGLSNATAGIPATFSVQTKDALGNNQTTDYEGFEPSELLQVTISSVGGNVVYYGDLLYMGNGLFTVTYFPIMSGNYLISVQMGDFGNAAFILSLFPLLVAGCS